MVIYFTRYHPIMMNSIKENYLMVHDYKLDEVLDKIKRIRIEKRDDSKILIDGNDKFLDDITLKNHVVLMICIIKDVEKFYLVLFLEEALYVE